MITTKQLKECDLTHKHGDNGFVMVEDLDKEYCRVVTHSAGKLDGLVRLAAKDRLTVSPKRVYVEETGMWVTTDKPMVIPDELLPKLTEIRTGITSGKLKVEKNRVVKV